MLRKEAVPVERIRIAAKRVPGDQVLRGEIRKERIEVESNGLAGNPGNGDAAQRKATLNRRRDS